MNAPTEESAAGRGPVLVSGRVAVILPTHNRAAMLSRAVRTVQAQTYTHWILIIVDDGSTDDTRDVVAGFHDPRVRYLHNEKPSGPSGARNTGIRAAEDAEFIAFLDDDDEWLPRKLELQVDLFRSNHEPLVAVGCGRVDVGRDESETHLPTCRGDIFGDLLARRARGYGAQLIMVRRRSGEPDIEFDADIRCLEDADYAMRVARRGPLDFVSEPLCLVRRDDDGPHAWNSAAAVIGYEKIMKKYAADLESRPAVRGYYHVCMARDLARLGRMGECRRQLRAALAAGKRRKRIVALLIGSLAGKFGVRVVNRLLPIDPPLVG